MGALGSSCGQSARELVCIATTMLDLGRIESVRSTRPIEAPLVQSSRFGPRVGIHVRAVVRQNGKLAELWVTVVDGAYRWGTFEKRDAWFELDNGGGRTRVATAYLEGVGPVATEIRAATSAEVHALEVDSELPNLLRDGTAEVSALLTETLDDTR